MKRILSIAVAAAVIISLLSIHRCTSMEKTALKVANEAKILIIEAEQQRETDFTAALEGYKKGVALLESIVRDYRNTATAKAIESGEFLIDGNTYEHIASKIYPKLVETAQASRDLFSLLLFLEEKSDNYITKISILQEISSAYLSLNDTKRGEEFLNMARALIDKHPSNAERIEKMSSLAICYYRYNKPFLSERLLSQAYRDIRLLDSPLLQDRLLLSIASAYLYIGRPDRADETANIIRDTYLKQAFVYEKTLSIAEDGDIERAFEMAATITDTNLKTRVYIQLAQEQAIRGDSRRAQIFLRHFSSTFSSLVRDIDEIILLNLELSKGYSKIPRRESEMMQYADEATNAAEKAPLNERNISRRVAVAAHLYDIGERDRAKRLLSQTPPLFAAIDNPTELIKYLAITYGELGYFNEAFETILLIQNRDILAEGAAIIARTQIERAVDIEHRTQQSIHRILRLFQ